MWAQNQRGTKKEESSRGKFSSFPLSFASSLFVLLSNFLISPSSLLLLLSMIRFTHEVKLFFSFSLFYFEMNENCQLFSQFIYLRIFFFFLVLFAASSFGKISFLFFGKGELRDLRNDFFIVKNSFFEILLEIISVWASFFEGFF